jgi:hypothetical protein
MALPSWAKDTVTRIRPATIDRRGSTVPDWSPDKVNELQISGCSVQPATTTLSQDGRVLGITDAWTCYFPPDADVAAGDKIMWNGKDYQLMGEPRIWTSPTGVVSSIQAQLERWSG